MSIRKFYYQQGMLYYCISSFQGNKMEKMDMGFAYRQPPERSGPGVVIILTTPKELFHMNNPEEIILCFNCRINITTVNKHRTYRKMFGYSQLS